MKNIDSCGKDIERQLRILSFFCKKDHFYFVYEIKKYYFRAVNETKTDMNKEILKEVIADNQIEISNYQVIKRDFNYEEFHPFKIWQANW